MTRWVLSAPGRLYLWALPAVGAAQAQGIRVVRSAAFFVMFFHRALGCRSREGLCILVLGISAAWAADPLPSRNDTAPKKTIAETMMATHAGMATDEFGATVQQWIATARHPRTGKLNAESTYDREASQWTVPINIGVT